MPQTICNNNGGTKSHVTENALALESSIIDVHAEGVTTQSFVSG